MVSFYYLAYFLIVQTIGSNKSKSAYNLPAWSHSAGFRLLSYI